MRRRNRLPSRPAPIVGNLCKATKGCANSRRRPFIPGLKLAARLKRSVEEGGLQRAGKHLLVDCHFRLSRDTSDLRSTSGSIRDTRRAFDIAQPAPPTATRPFTLNKRRIDSTFLVFLLHSIL